MIHSAHGAAPDPSEDFGGHLGTLAPRGERNVLIASLDSLLRALESVLSLHDEKGQGDLSVYTGPAVQLQSSVVQPSSILRAPYSVFAGPPGNTMIKARSPSGEPVIWRANTPSLNCRMALHSWDADNSDLGHAPAIHKSATRHDGRASIAAKTVITNIRCPALLL
jgi:hypothetical protein